MSEFRDSGPIEVLIDHNPEKESFVHSGKQANPTHLDTTSHVKRLTAHMEYIEPDDPA